MDHKISEYVHALNSMGESGIYWIDLVFKICVIALVNLANVIGITYEEINVWIFVIIWPTLTFYLITQNIFLKKKFKKTDAQVNLILSWNFPLQIFCTISHIQS